MLSAERAEQDLVAGTASSADRAARARWPRPRPGVGLVPEQAWEDADLAASPFGTAPECASIGFVNGKAAGSASPLTWSAAQFVRLTADLPPAG